MNMAFPLSNTGHVAFDRMKLHQAGLFSDADPTRISATVD
jgi:hypothetical protein